MSTRRPPRAVCSSTSSARSSSSSGAAARRRSSSSSSRCCCSSCSARSTRGRSKACRWPGRSSPGSIGYGCANTAFAGLAIQLVLRRESGILKRLRSTPLPPATYVAALLASTLVVFALQTVALFLLGRALYGTPFPSDIGSFVATIVIGAAVFAALGTATASVIRSAEGSSAVVNFILLPMAFLSGAFGPTRGYPAVLRAIGDVLPLTYFVKLVNAVYLHGARRLDAAGGAGSSCRLGSRRPRLHDLQVPAGNRGALGFERVGYELRHEPTDRRARHLTVRTGARRARHRGSRQLRGLRGQARDTGRDRRARAGAARASSRRSRSCPRSGTSSPTPSRRRCTRSSSRCHVRTRVTSPTSWRVRSSTPRTAGRSSASPPGTAPASFSLRPSTSPSPTPGSSASPPRSVLQSPAPPAPPRRRSASGHHPRAPSARRRG